MSKSDNDTNQMWRDVKDDRRQYKQNNRDLFLSMLDELRDTHDIKELTEYQYRVDGILDLYPSNRKWHLLPTGERGQFKNITKIKELLNQ
jgi:hypothetical protein